MKRCNYRVYEEGIPVGVCKLEAADHGAHTHHLSTKEIAERRRAGTLQLLPAVYSVSTLIDHWLGGGSGKHQEWTAQEGLLSTKIEWWTTPDDRTTITLPIAKRVSSDLVLVRASEHGGVNAAKSMLRGVIWSAINHRIGKARQPTVGHYEQVKQLSALHTIEVRDVLEADPHANLEELRARIVAEYERAARTRGKRSLEWAERRITELYWMLVLYSDHTGIAVPIPQRLRAYVIKKGRQRIAAQKVTG
jgi:hypothetical protein